MSEEHEESVIEANSIIKRYGKLTALDYISVKIKRKSIFGIVGPDGAGKSTFLKVIASIEKLDSGNIKYSNIRLDKGRAAAGEIAFMPEGLGANLYGELSVKENLEFFSSIAGTKNEAFQNELYEAAGLYTFKNRKQKNLSGGMSQKLGLISTMVQRPKIIILDEPTTGVDPLSRLELWRLIYHFNKENGTTFIISTSYINESSNCSDIILLYNGKIVVAGKPEELTASKSYDIDSSNLELYERLKKSYKVYLYKDKIRWIDDKDPSIERLDAHKTASSMEDLFLKSIPIDRSIYHLPLSPIELPDIVIKTEKLSKAYGSFFAMKDVSITVKSGDIVGLIGANGAGKTTLIKSLTGVLKTTSGRFWILDKEHQDIRSEIGYMSQQFSLYGDLTVKENLRLFGTLYRIRDVHKRITSVLSALRLTKFMNVLIEDLPVGIRQRTAFASAILHYPKLLFLDEPTSGVGPGTRQQFWDLIMQFSLTGRTVLLSTHYLDEAARCKSIIFMHEGRVLAAGTAEEIISKVSKKDEKVDIEQAFIRYIKPNETTGW